MEQESVDKKRQDEMDAIRLGSLTYKEFLRELDIRASTPLEREACERLWGKE